MGWFTTRVWFKVIVSFTLTLGWKNEKQPCGPIELDLEAGNLVFDCLCGHCQGHLIVKILDITCKNMFFVDYSQTIGGSNENVLNMQWQVRLFVQF